MGGNPKFMNPILPLFTFLTGLLLASACWLFVIDDYQQKAVARGAAEYQLNNGQFRFAWKQQQ